MAGFLYLLGANRPVYSCFFWRCLELGTGNLNEKHFKIIFGLAAALCVCVAPSPFGHHRGYAVHLHLCPHQRETRPGMGTTGHKHVGGWVWI